MYTSLRRSLAAVFIVVPFFSVFQAGAIIDPSLQMQLGNPSGATADPNNHQHFLIQRSVEAIDYNDTLGLPNWTSWDLTTADLGPSQRSPDFYTDTNLPPNFYQVTTTDYSGSGFDRGHMCPSADRTDNDSDNAQVFYVSNIVPQNANNNGGVWGSFEGYCRTLAQAGNELLIICGPGGFKGSFIQPSQRVHIPGYVWKIAVVVPPGAGTALSRITTATRVIAIKIPNLYDVNGAWQSYVTSAREIEVDTGFTFFTALPQNVADILRNKVDGQNNPAPAITDFSPGSGAVGSSVTITGVNFSAVLDVTFNGVSAPYTVNSTVQITATVPVNSVPGPLSVTTPTGTAVSSNNFIVTGSSADLTATVTHFGNFSQRDTGDTYTIVVTNLGTLASTGVVSIADMLPAGLTATSISGVGWTTNLATLTCTRSNSLLAGAYYPPITVVVNIASNAPAIVTNAATVTGGADSNPANNTANDPTTINPSLGGGGPVVTLFGWDVNGLPGGASSYGPSPYAATFVAPNLVVGGLTRGSGLTTVNNGAARAWGSTGFNSATAAAAVAANQGITFTSVAGSGYTVSYSAISKFDYRHSATGPSVGVLQCQIGSGAFMDISALSYPNNTNIGASLSPINLTGIAALQNIGPGTNVTFRIVNYGGAVAGTGTWYIFDVAGNSALDFVVQGVVAPVVTNFPDLAVSITHTGTFRQGDSGDIYTLIVTNMGTAATAGTVTLTDLLPSGFTASAISGPGWNADLGTLTCSRSENLSPGAAYPPVTLIVNVATNASALLTNSALVSVSGETNTANNLGKDPTVVVALTPIQFWRLQWFGNADNIGVGADSAIASDDGLPNLLKYALGLNPFAPASSPVAADTSTGFLRLTAPKNPSATDVTLFAETTDSFPAAWTTNGITIDQNGPSVFQAHRDVAIGAAEAGFMRLSVSRP